VWTLTGFADEISPELGEQLETLAQESMGYMELRSVWNTNVLDLTDDELERVKSSTAQRGIRISSIGSPIGKVPVTDPFGPHLERFRRAQRAADVMGAPYIRVFSFFIPEGHDTTLAEDDTAAFRDAVSPFKTAVLQFAEWYKKTITA
jgi:3-dehydroshikimate dehydratase